MWSVAPKLKIRKGQILFFLSGIIIFTGRFNGVNVNQYIKYIVAGVWGGFYVASVLAYRQKTKKKSDIQRHTYLMVLPFVTFFVYTLSIWILNGNAGIRNFTRLCSTILYLIIAWSFACCGYFLFGRQTVDILFWSGVCSYTLGSIIPLIWNYGIDGPGQYLLSIIMQSDISSSYMMEVHDLTFAMGLFFLYYAFFEPHRTEHHKAKLVLSIILIFLGLKRIEVLALAAATASCLIVLRKGKVMKKRSLLFFIFFTILSFAFVHLISNGIISYWAARLGINSMGRIGYYTFASDFYKFTPFYTGTGYTYFSRYWGKLHASGFRIGGYGIAASLHSDILVMYIELGFFMMILWLYYSFRYKTVALSKKYGTITGKYYLLATIFMFIIYFTDNTSTYFITQMIYFLIPLSISRTVGLDAGTSKNEEIKMQAS